MQSKILAICAISFLEQVELICSSNTNNIKGYGHWPIREAFHVTVAYL